MSLNEEERQWQVSHNEMSADIKQAIREGKSVDSIIVKWKIEADKHGATFDVEDISVIKKMYETYVRENELLIMSAAERAEHEQAEKVKRVRSRTINLGDETMKDTYWLIDNMIPMGEMSTIAGTSGIGKSTLLAKIIADLSNGLLEGEYLGVPSNSLYLTTEGSLLSMVLPRLTVAGADLRRVESVALEHNKHYTVPRGLKNLKDHIEVNDIKLVIYDPLMSYLDVKDPNDKKPVMDVLDELHAAIADLDVAVLVVQHHNKNTSQDANAKVSGSTALVEKTGSLITCYKLDGLLYLGVTKTNSGAHYHTNVYRTEGVDLKMPSGRTINYPRLEYVSTYPVHVEQKRLEVLDDMKSRGVLPGSSLSLQDRAIQVIESHLSLQVDPREEMAKTDLRNLVLQEVMGISTGTIDRALGSDRFTSERKSKNGGVVQAYYRLTNPPDNTLIEESDSA